MGWGCTCNVKAFVSPSDSTFQEQQYDNMGSSLNEGPFARSPNSTAPL